MNLPVLLTAQEVRDLSVDPDDLEPAGTYYSPGHPGLKGRMIGLPLYRSRDVRGKAQKEVNLEQVVS